VRADQGDATLAKLPRGRRPPESSAARPHRRERARP